MVSRAFILLIRLVILASEAMDDSMQWRPPFEEIGLVFLDFSEVSSHWMVFSVRSSNISHSWFYPFARIPLDRWFLGGSSFGSLNCHRELDIVTIFYAMMRTLGTEVLEIFKVLSK